MPALYRLPHRLGIALCVLTLMISGIVFPAHAQYGPYLIEGIKVDITADNAINARNQAFEKAQKDAFAKLAANILSPAALNGFTPPPAIGSLIQDYEVTQEKLSSKRYIGTYTFRFKERAVKAYFANYAQRPPQGPEIATPTQALPSHTAPLPAAAPAQATLLVLPFLERGRSQGLWSPDNAWLQAWQRSAGGTLVPIGDLDDARDVRDGSVMAIDYIALQRINARYGAREAVVALAREDGSVLNVALYRTDTGTPIQVTQISVVPMAGENHEQTFTRGVQLVQQRLNSDWKRGDIYTAQDQLSGKPSTTPALTLEARVAFRSLQEWAAAQRKINRTNGVQGLALKSLTPREARIALTYQGNPDMLALALGQAGLTLNPPSTGSGPYEISFSGNTARPAGPGGYVSPYVMPTSGGL